MLDSSGGLEWARSVGGDEEQPRPPYIVWRFKEDNEALQAMIVEGVRTFAGAAEWTVERSGRNWIMGPSHFFRFAEAFDSDVRASRVYAAEFAAETRAALQDAARLSAHLRTFLAARVPSEG